MTRSLTALICTIVILPAALAEDVTGEVVIRRVLTKHRVTPAATVYQRGPATELHADKPTDALSRERSSVVIYVEGVYPSSPKTLAMAQDGRRFSPETLVVPAGSTVSFPNDDDVFHNVFSLSQPKPFDLGNYSKAHTRSVTFSKPGVIFVGCHLHPNMSAAIVVTPNGWATKAEGSGAFALHDLPPGHYSVVAWHRAAGVLRKEIDVVAGRATNVEFFIPLEAEPMKGTR